jgi:PilZ domain
MGGPAASAVLSRFTGHALLVSGDLTAIRQITGAMQRFAFSLETCSDLELARRLLSTRKFHAIVVDVAFDQRACQLLDFIRQCPSNRNAVTFAIIESGVRSDSSMRPNFLLQKPLTGPLISSTLKAALGLIIRDYRRYFRLPLKMAANIQIAGRPKILCELINISEGGLALNLCPALELGAIVIVCFKLPDTPDEFHVEAEVCWSDNKCRAGLHFSSIAPEDKRKLQTWLSSKIEESFPEPIMQLFHKKE